ncbi:hypothetical protein [Microcoleus sp. FACHB-672]|uniref:hypothetical protein n=1 Tax=Microcoleus sp. FACHB-672 TaxID=2692825 RepID=UPI00168994F2|nr:hypothetical protein [Microcoleus sp. FACHB-672]MBD2041312.1 hypothetical protein [Microcoleus sp. FACHB-672]
MTSIGSYHVKVQIQAGGDRFASLSPAREADMPADWSFDWLGLWQNTDFECQNIVKLVYLNQVWGLARYGLYPYPGLPRFLEIEQLEANPTSRGEMTDRPIIPIGKWLIWYSIKVGLQYCLVATNEPLIILVSLKSAVSYYRDVIMMEYLEPVTIAPGEDGYAFRFSSTAAAAFCQRHENEWGVPTFIDE